MASIPRRRLEARHANLIARTRGELLERNGCVFLLMVALRKDADSVCSGYAGAPFHGGRAAAIPRHWQQLGRSPA